MVSEKQIEAAARAAYEEAMDQALAFAQPKLIALKKEKGLIGVWCQAFSSGWESSARVALAAAEVKPRVKPLEWHKSHTTSWDDDWHTFLPLIYTIRCADENGWKWSHGGGFGYEYSPSAAKAAAQADYEARILSALTTEGGE